MTVVENSKKVGGVIVPVIVPVLGLMVTPAGRPDVVNVNGRQLAKLAPAGTENAGFSTVIVPSGVEVTGQQGTFIIFGSAIARTTGTRMAALLVQ